MPPVNTGSFGANLGGVQALKAAMQRRGIDASVLDQISSAAPGPESPVAPTLPAGSPQVGATPGGVPAPSGTPTPTRSGEMEIALKALAQTVRTENKIAEASLQLGGL